ncbi:arginine-hydroxylase NDUFAF5, mitochondrial [Nilaparvata lugens]|uniref:arginine-hydroxylase NDUFAF5, mitochondrial n=1 Tax=Nilaparvata lugens TaxID=108931 RepID=UPI00193E2A38|nr:arginine-hydroxylase NDUFAF5, mitochondrial [Nilaparvata lugens]
MSFKNFKVFNFKLIYSLGRYYKGLSFYSTAEKSLPDSPMFVFDRQSKLLQKERAAQSLQPHIYDYLKDEVGFRLADRIFDIKRKFKLAIDLGCGRGHVTKNVTADAVEKLIICDSSPSQLEQAASPEKGVDFERVLLDEESLFPFEDNSVDLVISNLSLHWVNDLPGVFSKIKNCLVNDGVLLLSLFGGDSLYELRCSLQLADLERKGGVSAHISPFVKPQDLASLLHRCGFNMITIDVDEICIGYPSMFELMNDIKGMGENNAASKRSVHLDRDTMFAAAAIYQELYGREGEGGGGGVAATFQILYAVGWKPDASQPKPAQRGSGQVSFKDIGRLDQIASKTGQIDLGKSE